MSLLPPHSLDCGTPIPLRRQYCSHGDARERGIRAPGARLHIKHYGHCSGRGYSAHMTLIVSCSQNRQLDVRPRSTLLKCRNGSLQNLCLVAAPVTLSLGYDARPVPRILAAGILRAAAIYIQF
jgi:hypothetical protein